MMRRTFSVVLVSLACLLMVGSASANVTVDLVWLDNGTSALTVLPGDTLQNTNCVGFHFSGAGRCMKIVWTVDADGLFTGSNSVQWDSGTLSASQASFFIAFNAIPVGKTSSFGPFPAANQPGKNIGPQQVVGYTGSVPLSDPPNANYLGAGTYTVGTLVFDTGSAVGLINISSFLLGGFDGFLDSTGGAVGAVQLNGATLFVVPEPGTASLLGLGLLGLMAASRQRRNA